MAGRKEIFIMILLVENFFYGVENNFTTLIFYLHFHAGYYFPLALYAQFFGSKVSERSHHVYIKAGDAVGDVSLEMERKSCAAAMCEISHSTREISYSYTQERERVRKGHGN
jgi:hypothetical protein